MKRFLKCCTTCGKGESVSSDEYLPYFLSRDFSSSSESDMPLLNSQVNDFSKVYIGVFENGEVCSGQGLISEIVRYPPSPSSPHHRLSFTVWQDREENEAMFLVWRRFYEGIAAFFYVLDCTSDRGILDLIGKEIYDFSSQPAFPHFYGLTLCNNEKLEIYGIEDGEFYPDEIPSQPREEFMKAHKSISKDLISRLSLQFIEKNGEIVRFRQHEPHPISTSKTINKSLKKKKEKERLKKLKKQEEEEQEADLLKRKKEFLENRAMRESIQISRAEHEIKKT